MRGWVVTVVIGDTADYQWRKGNNRRDEKVITLFHPGFVAIAAEDEDLGEDESEKTTEDEEAKAGLTRKNVAFLMTYVTRKPVAGCRVAR